MVITGFSGAGKSQAMACFEDAGYFCVDNLPPEMIASLAELFAHEGSKVERAAVVCDVRGGIYFEGIAKVLDELAARGTPTGCCSSRRARTCCSTATRRPAAATRSPRAARCSRRDRAGARAARCRCKERADVAIDTSDLSASRLRKVVADKMLPHDGKLGSSPSPS